MPQIAPEQSGTSLLHLPLYKWHRQRTPHLGRMIQCRKFRSLFPYLFVCRRVPKDMGIDFGTFEIFNVEGSEVYSHIFWYATADKTLILSPRRPRCVNLHYL